MPDQTDVPLDDLLQDALTPFDSLSNMLKQGGDYNTAVMVSALVGHSRERLKAVNRCLEEGCGRQITLHNFGGVLAPGEPENLTKNI